jgi:hypothetical protein
LAEDASASDQAARIGFETSIGRLFVALWWRAAVSQPPVDAMWVTVA